MPNHRVEPSEDLDTEPVETEANITVQERPLMSTPAEIVRMAEEAADLAPRWTAAIWKLCAARTFPEDWHRFGDGDDAVVCLKSAGAERIAATGAGFPIRFHNISPPIKETWTDKLGEAYRYTYCGYATMGDRTYYITASYSSREPFVSKAHGTHKPIEEINENHVRTSAYHFLRGEGIKAHLGIRGGIPLKQFEKLMGAVGQDAGKTKGHTYAKGAKGGVSDDDRSKQNELGKLVQQIADANYSVVFDPIDGHELVEVDPDLVGPAYDRGEHCRQIVANLTAFKGKDGKRVDGVDIRQLAGKRLDIAISKARQFVEQIERGPDAD